MHRRNFLKAVGVGAAIVAVPINLPAAPKGPTGPTGPTGPSGIPKGYVPNHPIFDKMGKANCTLTGPPPKRKVERFRIHFGPISDPSKSYTWWEEVQMKDLREGDWFRMYEPDGSLISYGGDTQFFATEDPERVKEITDKEVWSVAGKGLSEASSDKELQRQWIYVMNDRDSWHQVGIKYGKLRV